MAIEKRTYANSEKAKAAMDELSSQGFSDVKVSFKPDNVLVAVDAPFGEGQRAARILDSHGPSASDDGVRADDGAGRPTNAGSFDLCSLAGSPTPLSDFFGWSVLKDYKSPFWPEALVDDPTPLSNRMGWSVLGVVKEGADSKIKDPATPLSNLLGWSVLSNYRSPFWPEALVDDPTPLSNKLGWSVLSGASNGAARRHEAHEAHEAIVAPVAAPAQDVAPADVPQAKAAQVSDVAEASQDEAASPQAADEPESPQAAPATERKRGRRSAKTKGKS